MNINFNAIQKSPAALAALQRAISAAKATGNDTGMFLPRLDPSPEDPRDGGYPFIASGKPVLSLLDLSPLCAPIRDQLSLGSCTAFGTDGACGYFTQRAGRYVLRSPSMNYKLSRELGGYTGDSGAVTRDALKAARKFGLAMESLRPYDVNTYDEPVTPEQSADGAQHTLYEFRRIHTSLSDERLIHRRIMASLNDGRPVVIAGWVMQWLRELIGPIHTHPSQRNPDNTWLIGAHCMVIVGADEGRRLYKVRQSWGTTKPDGTPYGESGYIGLTFDDMGTFFEFWSVSGFDGEVIGLPAYDIECDEAKAGRLYRAALGRGPDAAGLAYQASAVTTNGLVTVAGHFLASPEFQGRYGANPSDEQYVTLLYANVLGREPDAAGKAYQINALATGTSRAQLLVNFSESPENKAPV